jgi:hypothetical protein
MIRDFGATRWTRDSESPQNQLPPARNRLLGYPSVSYESDYVTDDVLLQALTC